MLLRPRQKLFVERSLAALDLHGNTLGIAPTGAGKTIMLSATVGERLADSEAKALVLAHRDELTAQNRSKFERMTPGVATSVVDAVEKSWNGQVTFAMVPTLTRATNLDAMPAVDVLVVDEAHHAVADSYRRIIDRALHRNPRCGVYGVTAAPNRSDGRGLRDVFSNVADQIRLGELVRSGHLVPPRTFVVDVGVQDELQAVRQSGDEFDMAEVSRVMNTVPVTKAVIAHWREKAGGRQTVVFCSTVEHATAVAAAFDASGVPTVLVTGEMPDHERRSVLAAYAAGEAQVVVNVAVLTEGWDHPPTSCVVLLRPSSFKCTMIQMVGRGLRTVSPEEYPGIVKTDCVIFDFGTSSLVHGSLEQDVDLVGHIAGSEAPTRTCPYCEGQIPLACTTCPLCNEAFGDAEQNGPPEQVGAGLSDFVMTEIDLLTRSSFEWCDLFGDDAALVANGFHGWGGIFFLSGRWHAVGGCKGQRTRLPSVGERLVCLAAADDWLANKGVAAAKPVYAAQIAVYQAYMDAVVPGVAEHPALFTAINKDTAELHHELVPFDAELAQRMGDRDVRVLRATDAGELLPRIIAQPSHRKCHFCPWPNRCWGLPT